MEEITVILNGYKRPEYLREQVEAVKAQTIKPKEIWIWCNTHELAELAKEIPGIDVIVDSSRNFKFHGRFALGLLAKTKYLAYFDDDTIPGCDWFKNCLNTLKDKPFSILGGAGVTLESRHYAHHVREGWPKPCNEARMVDLVGHAWFFERELLNALWAKIPCSLDNGEDIQLSFLAYTLGKVCSYTPPHPPDNKNMWSSIKAEQYGNDKKASSNGSLMDVPTFYAQRDYVVDCHLKMGYVPVLARK